MLYVFLNKILLERFSLLFYLLTQCSCRTQVQWKSCSICVLQILLLHAHAASKSHLETNCLACVRALTPIGAKQKKCIFLHIFVQNLSTLVPLYYCAFPLLLQLLCIFTRLLQLSIFFFFFNLVFLCPLSFYSLYSSTLFLLFCSQSIISLPKPNTAKQTVVFPSQILNLRLSVSHSLRLASDSQSISHKESDATQACKSRIYNTQILQLFH